jgi:polyphosphate glucokinase
MGQALAVADSPLTLAIDCGGSGIKGSIVSIEGDLLTERIRHETPYPLSPDRLIGIIEQIAAALPPSDRVTVGIPGMVRGGRVIATPHYITTAGPFTPVDPSLRDAWFGFDLQTVLAEKLGLPTLALNDADVQGFGVISGIGMEVVITLGTGFGTAYYMDGQVGTHLELSQAPVRKNVNYDQWIGDLARRDIGDERWTARVIKALDGMRAVFLWDRCYVGGGNTKNLVQDMPDDVTIVPNVAGIIGGAKAWEFLNR